MSGKHYGRYELEQRLAMGGMAEIFSARIRTEGFEKRVCIKRILPHYLESEEFITMFRDEARTAARLQHANVVQVFDFGDVEGTLFLAMELVDGSDLRRVLETARKQGRSIAVGAALQIAIDMCKGLHHAHTLSDGGRALGIVHRDVSPHNVLISKAGEVKVTDFGIARAAERATHTSTGMVKGKIAYMAPEQAQGLPFDHRLDQFATGVVLWEMLAGRRLFAADNDASTLKKVLACQVPPLAALRPEVPAALDEVLARVLREAPADRFADMRQLEVALQRVLFSGAVDPATADVRAMYEGIMSGAAESPRKTAVLDSGALASAPPPVSGSPVIVGLPPPAMTESHSRLADEPASSASSGEAGGSVAAVFASSEKMAPAPGPTRSSPSLSRALAPHTELEPSGPDPNARTMREDDPRALELVGDPMLRDPPRSAPVEAQAAPPPAITATATPVSRRAATSEDERLPSLSQLEREEAERARQAEEQAEEQASGTPATHTAVPASAGATVRPPEPPTLPLVTTDEASPVALPGPRRVRLAVAALLVAGVGAIALALVLRGRAEPGADLAGSVERVAPAGEAPPPAPGHDAPPPPALAPTAAAVAAAPIAAAPVDAPAAAAPPPAADDDLSAPRTRPRSKLVAVLVRTPRYSGYLFVGNERLEISPQGNVYRLPSGTLAVRVQRGDGPSRPARITVVPGETTVVSLE